MDFVKWVWYQWLLILVENLFILKLRKVPYVLKVYGLWLKDSKNDRLLWTIVLNIQKSTSTALLSVAPDIWGIAAIEIVKYILSFDEEFSRFYASIFTIACASLGLNICRRTRTRKSGQFCLFLVQLDRQTTNSIVSKGDFPDKNKTRTENGKCCPPTFGFESVENHNWDSIFLGFITLCFIKEDLGRQRAENDEK